MWTLKNAKFLRSYQTQVKGYDKQNPADVYKQTSLINNSSKQMIKLHR